MPAFVKLTFRGNSPSANWFTFCWSTENGTPSDLQDLANLERDTFNGEFASFLSPNYSLSLMTAIWWPNFDTVALPTISLPVTPVVGTDTGNDLDPRQTLMLEFKTQLAKPAPQKKRCFIGRYTENRNDAGGPANGVVGNMVDWANSHINPLTPNGHQFNPVSLALQQTLGGDVIVARAANLVSYLLPTGWAWVRSRGVGRGI